MSRKNERRRSARRAVLPGYPWEGKFSTKEQIETYLGGNVIICLICGQRKQNLVAHVLRIHEITEQDYKVRYGLPWSRGLTSGAAHQKYIAGTHLRLANDPKELAKSVSRAREQAARKDNKYKRPMQPFHLEIMRRMVRSRGASKPAGAILE